MTPQILWKSAHESFALLMPAVSLSFVQPSSFTKLLTLADAN